MPEESVERSILAEFPEMNPGPVYRLDRFGKVTLAYAAARKIFGKNVIGQSWLDICPGINPAIWKTIHSTSGPVPHEAQVGECIFVFTHRCDPVSKVVFVFGADIPNQKLAEKALR